MIASEWLKLRSVSSTRYAIGAAALVIVLGAVWSFYVGTLADARGSIRAAAPEEGFLPLVQISLALVGVLAVTAEYGTGTIRPSLTAVPRRRALLAAKATVVAAATTLPALAVIFITHAVSHLIAGDRAVGYNAGSFGDDLPLLLGSVLSVTVLALVGLGLGVVTRSTAAAVGSVVGLLFVLPGIAPYLPQPWNVRVGAWMLPNLVPQIAGERISTRLDGLLPPAAAVAVLAGYALVALVAAFLVFERRDA
ncbi:ABC transporter permease subunit [Nonomuraea dietziae]|uniref:ABC-type transport system involved in multi-copper enzyme maturation permease subunit n=1 Tax=Nonomuraea dietziae TaxID=65515 RepID=A0A7W5VAY6_9ACTN|nr:ABC transporter permease subunit [Nonomuraea dietziae]MBB3731426.1 ABC-type transport system involved in multi-copper enzyme maturation permease subunit [Nonomuraea dietziae]